MVSFGADFALLCPSFTPVFDRLIFGGLLPVLVWSWGVFVHIHSVHVSWCFCCAFLVVVLSVELY